MDAQKHTPGPWMAPPYSSVVGLPIVASPSGRSIAKVTYFDLGEGFENHNAESVANARLIAAAPDLLAAIKKVLPLIPGHTKLGCQGDCSACMAGNEARAAIAKATA
jgi:hypothetical protein